MKIGKLDQLQAGIEQVSNDMLGQRDARSARMAEAGSRWAMCS